MDKDEDEKLSDQQKVNAIINGTKVQDVQLMAATSYIAGQYLRDVTMACAYFSREVARIHGSDQVAVETNRPKRRGIYSADSGGSGRGHFFGRGCGRGQVFGRSDGRGRGGSGQSRGGSGGMSDFNGIDISDSTYAFTDEEWTAIGPGCERAHVTQKSIMINGRGCGRDAGRGGRGRSIAAVEIVMEQENVDETTGRGGRGGRNGVRFGCGGYRT